jgi:hypothetical protein
MRPCWFSMFSHLGFCFVCPSDMAEFMLLQRIPTTIQWDPRQHTASEQWWASLKLISSTSPTFKVFIWPTKSRPLFLATSQTLIEPQKGIRLNPPVGTDSPSYLLLISRPVCTEEDTTASPLTELPNGSLEAVLWPRHLIRDWPVPGQ